MLTITDGVKVGIGFWFTTLVIIVMFLSLVYVFNPMTKHKDPRYHKGQLYYKVFKNPTIRV